MKKRNILITALAILTVTVLVGGIYAYLSDKDDVENKIIVAENKVEITEEFPEQPVQKSGENDYTKQVAVTNTGNVPCYVRVFIDFPDADISKRAYLSYDEENYYAFALGTDDALPTANDDNTVQSVGLTDEQEESITLYRNLYKNFIDTLTKVHASDTDYWIYDSNDGFYYYTGKLDAGQTTENLFNKVLIYNDSGKGQTPRDTEMYVYTESIVTQDINENIYANYREAWDNFYTKT